MGKFFKILFGLLGGGGSKAAPSASITEVLRSGYDADKPILRTEDRKLSDNFFLSELTHTDNAALQEVNRTLSDNQVQKLGKLARHGEAIRSICGGSVRVHSGYRSDALNSTTAGSSSTSQHPKCEALDFDIIGQSLDDSFQRLYAAAKAGRFQFGQLIIEEATRSYGVARWLHCSIRGSLSHEKIGEVLKMQAGSDGIPHYIFVDKIKFIDVNGIES